MEEQNRDKGARFERLIRAAFEADPGMGYDKVWLWQDYPGRKGGQDLGVDLVARHADTGSHVAIQCKFWKSQNITLRDVNAFLAASGRSRFAGRILVHTAPGIEGYGWTQIREAHPPCDVVTLTDLRRMQVDWWSLAEASGAAARQHGIPAWPVADRRQIRGMRARLRHRTRGFFIALVVSAVLLISAVAENRIGGVVLLGTITACLVALRINDYWDALAAPSTQPTAKRSETAGSASPGPIEDPATYLPPSVPATERPSPPSQSFPSQPAPQSDQMPSAPQRSSLPPPPPPSQVPPPEADEQESQAEPRSEQPERASDVVNLARRYFGMPQPEVVRRAEGMFGPGRADRSTADLSRLWNAIIDEQTVLKRSAQPPIQQPGPVTLARSAEDLLSDLTPEQCKAVTISVSPLCVIAGAGSGKTRVLTRRIAYQAITGAIDPQHVLAVTFTRRAAGELRKRLRQLGIADAVAAGTFHASALSMLRRHWEAKGESHPTILQSRTALLGDLRPDWGPKKLRTAEASISWATARMVTPEEYPGAIATGGRRDSSEDHEVAALYRDYVIAKQERRCIDFDDMLDLARRALADDPAFAADQHRRQRHLLVDEFQDVNPLQFELLKAWLGRESTLVVVGDPRQAIFGWNGADPELLVQIDQHLHGVTRVSLGTNFRSTPEICEASGKVLNVRPQPTVRPNGMQPRVRELLGLVVPADLATYEASEIAKAVRAAHRPGTPWGDQAILARTNPQLDPIRDALNMAGIPVRSRSEQTLLQIPEIQDFLLDYEETDRLSILVGDLEGMATADIVSEVWDHLLEFARDALALDPVSSVRDLVDALQSDDGLTPIEDGVDLSTIHRAKGLEWPVVHLIAAEDGYHPDYRNRMGERRREERRLLYVAASRAETELHISWCRLRDRGSRSPRKRYPSPWIKGLLDTPR